jgi:hypothetical protein
VAVCAALGVLWGWTWTAGVLLDLGLSVASTIVLRRILEERSSLDQVEGPHRDALAHAARTPRRIAELASEQAPALSRPSCDGDRCVMPERARPESIA